MMRVTILGAGTAIPVRGRSPAALYVRAGREHLLLDAGSGTLQRLHAIGVTFLDLDRIFLTHYHIDHCLDLAAILFAMRIPRPPGAAGPGASRALRTKPLTVYGPRGLRALYRGLNDAFHGWLTPRGYRLTLKELGETTLRLPGYTVRTRRMNHYDTGAIGYRVSAGGKTLAYSGDTDVAANVIALGREADLLALECSMPDEQKSPGHLTPSECGRIAAAAGCRRLALVHFYPLFRGYDIRRRVRRAFRGRLTLARDLTSVCL